MKKLSLETLINAAEDPELSRYKILAALKDHLSHLHKNRLYPPFAELISAKKLIDELVKSKQKMNETFPKKIRKFDIKNKKTVYEQKNYTDSELNRMFDFIDWMMPKLKEALLEGKSIFDFVDENLNVTEVGIVSLYKREGYFIVPDNKLKRLNVYRFEMSLFEGGEEPIRILKTNLINSYEKEKYTTKSYEEIKLEMIKNFPEMPNPITFRVETELDFPFNETILPIAKRKLIQKLAA